MQPLLNSAGNTVKTGVMLCTHFTCGIKPPSFLPLTFKTYSLSSSC